MINCVWSHNRPERENFWLMQKKTARRFLPCGWMGGSIFRKCVYFLLAAFFTAPTAAKTRNRTILTQTMLAPLGASYT